MKRIALVLVVAGLTVGLLPQAAAGASVGTTTYSPSPGAFWDFSQCDDGGDAAVCTASATLNSAGVITTEASLRPAETIATAGRAEGRGGLQVSHRLMNAYSAVRYRFYFEGVTALAQKDPALARDIEARAFVAGHVTHGTCDSCTANAWTVVADADPLTSEAAQVNATAWRLDVELRNPVGKVPKGWTSATGYLLSDVGLYQDALAFTSSAQANASGRLVRVEVEPVV